MPGTVVRTGHTTVNATKIPSLIDSIIFEKSMFKGNKLVKLRSRYLFSHERKSDTLINIYNGSSRT